MKSASQPSFTLGTFLKFEDILVLNLLAFILPWMPGLPWVKGDSADQNIVGKVKIIFIFQHELYMSEELL